MELTPLDMGKERYLTLMRRRVAFGTQQSNGMQSGPSGNVLDESPLHPKVQKRTRRLRKYWSQNLNLDEATADELTQIAWKGAPGMTPRIIFTILSTYMFIGGFITAVLGGSPFIVLVLLVAWLSMAYAMAYSGKTILRRLHERTLRAGEIDTLLPVARGRLERSYLNLVRDVVQQDIPSVSAQVDIRAALRDLGDTISRLPAEAVPNHDPDSLRTEADDQRMKARLEPDAFVQASLLRQAAALDRRATLASQNASSARRTRALRREAKSQIDALHAVMLAFQQTSHADALGVEHLSEAVQRVAQEAQAASVARRELDEDEISMLLGKPVPANLPTQPVLAADPATLAPQPLTQPTAAAQEPAVQVLQPGRPWWRGQ